MQQVARNLSEFEGRILKVKRYVLMDRTDKFLSSNSRCPSRNRENGVLSRGGS